MPRPASIALAASLLPALLALAACIPSRVVIDLAPPDGELEETAVITDQAAPSAKVALIDVTGFISHVPAPALVADRANTIDSLVARLDKAADDPAVRAVVLRINSPGGTVAASQSAYAEVLAFRERSAKPVVVSMGDVAASGGYYLALAADRIIAQPASITGSVGVIFQTLNVSRGLDKIGVHARAIVSHPNKDIANPLEPEDPNHVDILQGMVDTFYDDFRSLVIVKRPDIDHDDIPIATDGRVFTGRQALDIGLVDEIGSLREAFAAAKALARLEHATLVKYHAEGDTIATPYASAAFDHPDHAGAGRTQLNLFQLNIAGLNDTPGFCYLWRP